MSKTPPCLRNLFSKDPFYHKLSVITLYFFLYHKYGEEGAREKVRELLGEEKLWFLPKPSWGVELFYAKILKALYNNCSQCPLQLEAPACFYAVGVDELEKFLGELGLGRAEEVA